MPKIVDKPGVGNRLIRLADIPERQRITAARRLARTEAKTLKEAARLMQLALYPGDASGRIAA